MSNRPNYFAAKKKTSKDSRTRLYAEEERPMLYWLIDAWLASFALLLELVDRAPFAREGED
jgi:hypothetical protein